MGRMIIHYSPTSSQYPAIWSQPKPDTLRCEWHRRVFECDFSHTGVVYEIPEAVREVIQSAWRDRDGVLNVLVPSLSRNAQVEIAIDHGASVKIGPGGTSMDDGKRSAERERIAPILQFLAEDMP